MREIGAGSYGFEFAHSVRVDSEDNIYVTDSQAGKIFVFDANGKFRRMIGALKGGEGYFKRPTGIAVDSAAQKIYITDTLRDKIFGYPAGEERASRGGGIGSANRRFLACPPSRLPSAIALIADGSTIMVPTSTAGTKAPRLAFCTRSPARGSGGTS